MTILITRNEHEAAEHARRIVRERRERESAGVGRPNTVGPYVQHCDRRAQARAARRKSDPAPYDVSTNITPTYDSVEQCKNCGSYRRFVDSGGCVECFWTLT